jgi:AcrR family transcriptional regulator
MPAARKKPPNESTGSGKARRPANALPKPGTRDRILDVAELEFSTRGYDATSLRMISEAHNINLGLIHYYFGGKEGLFSAVFLRRSKTLVNRRLVLLGEARRRYGKEPIPVDEIIRCFITPTVEMIKEGEGPRAYIRLQGLLRSDPFAFGRKLRGEAFNETNRKFIRELRKSCPHLTAASVVWRFASMVGAYYSLISQAARVDELSNGLCDSSDIDAAIGEVIPFVVGGFVAPAALPGANTKSGNGKLKKRNTSRTVSRIDPPRLETKS